MKRNLLLAPWTLLAALVAFGCSSSVLAIVAGNQPSPRSYLELPDSGKLSVVPYVWEREAHGRHIAVIGTRHNGDPRSPMYDRIEAVFKRVRPQLVLHESEAPADLATDSRSLAIARGADLGFAVYLAGRYGALVESGDAPVKDEFKMLLARYPVEDVYVFLTAQRLIGSARNPDLKQIATEYPAFLQSYLVPNGLPKQPELATWNDFLQEYARIVGKPLASTSWNPDLFSPTQNSGRLNEIARSSDVFRDQHLLAAIQSAMHEHERVVVVFGGWHVLALEPELDGVLKN